METYPSPRRPVSSACRIHCSNVRDLAGNLSDLTVTSFQYDILLCSETLVSDIVPGFGSPVLLCRDKMPRARGIAEYYEMATEHFANPNLSVVVAKWRFIGSVV